MKRRKKAQKFSISDVRSYCLLLALAGLLLLVPGAVIMPLLDRDEPKFSEATREMMVNRNWIVPYFNNEYRFDKPVLTYWLMSLGYRAFGVNELGARVHSILSTILLALAVFAFGRRLVGERGALWGAITMLLSAQFFVHGRGAVADMPMVLAVAIAMFGIHQLLFGEGKDRRANFLITYLALGLGFLAKGPIAILVPVLALALYGVFSWRARRKDQDEALAEAPLWRRLHLILGALVALAVVAPWGIRALVLTEGAFWDVGVGRHVVDRGMRAFNKRIPIPGYYFVTFFLSAAPWAAWIGHFLIWLRRNWTREHAFLVAWWMSPYLIFLCYRTQLPHYVLPGLPAFFLLFGKFCQHPGLKFPRWCDRLKTAVFALYTTVGVIGLGMMFAPLPSVRYVGAALALIAAGLLFAARAKKRPGWVPVLGGLLLLAAGAHCLGKGLRVQHPVIALQPTFATLPENARCAYWGFSEPSIVFYSKKFWNAKARSAEDVQDLLDSGSYDLIVTLETELKPDRWFQAKYLGKELKMKDRRADLDTIQAPGYEVAKVEGLNIPHGSWVVLRTYRKAEQ